MRTAHAAEMRELRAFLRQRFIMEFSSGDGIEAQIELIFPAEFESRFAEGIVAITSGRMAFREIGGMSRDLISNHAVFDILLVWQPEMLLGGDIAQHCRPIPTNHGCA